MSTLQRVVVLGSTGSIGESTLDVIARHPDRLCVYALSAYTRMEKLAFQAAACHAKVVIVPTEEAAARFRQAWQGNGPLPEIRIGAQALVETAADTACDTVMAAIVGVAGLPSVFAAACAGKRILLANKEALVVAGPLFMRAVHKYGAELLPIDSEHNAIFQCLPHGNKHLSQGRQPLMQEVGSVAQKDLSLLQEAGGEIQKNFCALQEDREEVLRRSVAGVRRFVLTASGGPFRDRPLEALQAVTPEEACAHPNWSMGRKISVDCATMLNKGLEVIEAHWLFAMPAADISVMVHPQSVVHAMVEYEDGSVLAQLGLPDMRTPIAYALGFPQRLATGVGLLDLTRWGRLDFYQPDLQRFPCLALAFDALTAGQSACIALNAANEVAVDAFLQGQLAYGRIPEVIEATLTWQAGQSTVALDNLSNVLAQDAEARRFAHQCLAELTLLT